MSFEQKLVGGVSALENFRRHLLERAHSKAAVEPPPSCKEKSRVHIQIPEGAPIFAYN